MRHIFTFFCLVLIINLGLSQDYFQQEVNYKIDVSLDDENHYLHGFEYIEYTNNSKDTLSEIQMHLWPNAYKNGETALAKQLFKRGDEGLRFAEEKERGWIDSLNFKVDGKKLELIYHEEHVDIASLKLNEPLAPGGKIVLSTPFRVKLPNAKFSRLGHVGQSYMITQWYPKPAVYDKNGWNAMPYLNQGEFYSEYGAFEVSITLPQNYVVGATGDLQNEEEHAFLAERSAATREMFKEKKYGPHITMKFPASSKEMKTLTYKQKRVHDFAWFADKRFQVLTGEVELPESKRKVKSYAMFTPRNANTWEDAIEYINDGTYYYSKWNGDYPYNQVTAVDGTIAAGGGMEYPNVTVIGNTGSKKSLEIVIVHEVGHNWFYGILGSNERTHAWMDEGLNTLNEVRYIQTKYPENTRLSDAVLNGAFRFHDCDYHDQNDLSFRTVQSLGLDQPMDLHSDDFASINYGIVVYQKTGLVFDYLKHYLGEDKFDKIMHYYFENWKFKHPQPEDLQACFESQTGEDFSWLFNDIIKTANPIDYKLKSVKQRENTTEVKVKSKGHIHGPIPVQLITSKGDTLTQWTKAYSEKEKLVFASDSTMEVVVDMYEQVPELNRTNNTWKKDWLINKVEPVKLNAFFSANRRDESNFTWMPALGANTSDKFMLGVQFGNMQVPLNKLSFTLTPMYSFGRKNLSGIGEFVYNFSPASLIKHGKLGLSLRSFGDMEFSDDRVGGYHAALPYLNLELGKRGAMSKHSNRILFQAIYKASTRELYNQQDIGGFVDYQYKYSRPLHAFTMNARGSYLDVSTKNSFETNTQLSRISLDAKYRLSYYLKDKKNYVEVRGFYANNVSWTGDFYNAQRYSIPVAGNSGDQDLFLEEYYFGRNETSGFWANQHNDNMGGIGYSTNLSATDWMYTANLYAQIPVLKGLFGVYGDYGQFSSFGTTYEVYDLGVGLRLGDILRVYFPVYQNSTLENGNAYQQRIKLSLKLNLVNSGLLNMAVGR